MTSVITLKTGDILTIEKSRFATTREFWLTFAVDPQEAVSEVYPKVREVYLQEQQMFGETTLSAADVFCVLIETTSSLVDESSGKLGVDQLPYDPVAFYGTTAIAALVDVAENQPTLPLKHSA